MEITRLLNPNRLVIIERKLKYPKDKIIREFCTYCDAQLLVLEFPYEDNTASLWIRELGEENVSS